MERRALEQPPSFGARVADKKNLFQGFEGMAGGAVIAAVVGARLGVGSSVRDHPSIMSEVRCWATIAYPCMAEERVWVDCRLARLAGDERWRCRSGWRDFLIGRPEHPHPLPSRAANANANTAGTASALHLHHPSPPPADRR
jgi:hypothetical protein